MDYYDITFRLPAQSITDARVWSQHIIEPVHIYAGPAKVVSVGLVKNNDQMVNDDADMSCNCFTDHILVNTVRLLEGEIKQLRKKLSYRTKAMQLARNYLASAEPQSAWNALYEPAKGDLLGQAAAGVVEREKARESDSKTSSPDQDKS